MTTPPPPPSAAALLEHRAFLSRLLGALVRDEHEVEDLIQDTWNRALRQPPRQSAGLRAWLGRVALNLARNRVRERERRHRRERLAATAEALPSTAESLERLLLHREVVDAVLALPESMRDAVMLRYFEGRPPREVARITGVSLEAVKGRLKRALAQLRQKLDDRRDGDRSAWIALAWPRGGDASPGAAGSVATLCLTALSSGPKLQLTAMATVVILLVSGMAWLQLDPERAVEETPTANIEQPDEGSRAALVDLGAGAGAVSIRTIQDLHEELGAEPAWLRSGAHLRGRVHEPSGLPAAGARVVVEQWSDEARWPTELPRTHANDFRTEAVCSRDGRFECWVPVGVAVVVKAELLPWAPSRSEVHFAGELIDLHLRRVTTAQVRVVDADGGRALAGARVELRLEPELGAQAPAATALCNGAGELDLEFPEGSTVVLSAHADGYASNSVQRGAESTDARAETAPHRWEIPLETAARIHGRVLDQDRGVPIVDAEVRGLAEWTPVGPGGEYSLSGFRGSARSSWTIQARAPGYSTRAFAVALDVAGGTRNKDLELRAGVCVVGRVLDANGGPLRSARLLARSLLLNHDLPGIGGHDERRATSAEDGSFRLEGLQAHRSYHLLVEIDSAAAVHDLGPLPDRSRLDLGEITIDASSTLYGTIPGHVLRPAGSGLVRVQRSPGGPMSTLTQVAIGRCDSEGRFQLSGLAPGAHRIELHPPGARDWDDPLAVQDVLLPSGGSVEVKLTAPPKRITGSVTIPGGGPIPRGLQVVARQSQSDPDVVLRTRVALDGSFGLRLGRSEMIAVEVLDPLGRFTAEPLRIDPRSTEPVLVPLRRCSPAVSLAGRLVLRRPGLLPSDLVVVAWPDAPAPYRMTDCDAEGRFRFEDLGSVAYDLVVMDMQDRIHPAGQRGVTGPAEDLRLEIARR